MKQIIHTLTLCIILASCHSEPTYTETKVNNSYAISVPDYMKPADYLHKQASFQCADTLKDIYAIVMDEKKKTLALFDLNFTLDTYFENITKQPFLTTIENGKISTPIKNTVGGNNALTAEITGTVKDKEIFYRMAIVETETAFYQILVWTKAEKKEEMLPVMNKIIHSFREFPIPKEEPTEKTNK